METGTQWQAIESAPRDGTHILLYDYQAVVGWWGKDGTCIWGQWVYGPGYGKFGDEYQTLTPTHWMPLPEAPK